MNIHNYMEDLVSEAIDQMLEENKTLCRCDKCRLDVMAMVLNKLPSKYVVSMKGHAYTKIQTLDMQFRTDILQEVTKALDKIAKNPRH